MEPQNFSSSNNNSQSFPPTQPVPPRPPAAPVFTIVPPKPPQAPLSTTLAKGSSSKHAWLWGILILFALIIATLYVIGLTAKPYNDTSLEPTWRIDK